MQRHLIAYQECKRQLEEKSTRNAVQKRPSVRCGPPLYIGRQAGRLAHMQDERRVHPSPQPRCRSCNLARTGPGLQVSVHANAYRLRDLGNCNTVQWSVDPFFSSPSRMGTSITQCACMYIRHTCTCTFIRVCVFPVFASRAARRARVRQKRETSQQKQQRQRSNEQRQME